MHHCFIIIMPHDFSIFLLNMNFFNYAIPRYLSVYRLRTQKGGLTQQNLMTAYRDCLQPYVSLCDRLLLGDTQKYWLSKISKPHSRYHRCWKKSRRENFLRIFKMCTCGCVYATCVQVCDRGRKRAWMPWSWSYRRLHTTWRGENQRRALCKRSKRSSSLNRTSSSLNKNLLSSDSWAHWGLEWLWATYMTPTTENRDMGVSLPLNFYVEVHLGILGDLAPR